LSREILEKIIGRAAIDPRFRSRMLESPEMALEEYHLDEQQMAAIKRISKDALEKFAHQLMEKHKARAGSG